MVIPKTNISPTSVGSLPEVLYPRVLIISRASISDADNSGVSRGRWFQTWPKDRIAQIYSSEGSSVEPFCPIRYEFGARDRQFGRLFGVLKRSSWVNAFRAQRVVTQRSGRLRTTVRKLKNWTVGWVAASGLWELAFVAQVSDGLLEWCGAFQPDILYSTCTDLSYVELTLQLAEALQVPLCLQVEDDWLGTLYTRGLARLFIRGRLERNIRRLLAMSSLRLSNGPLMTEAYLRDYGYKFEAVYLSDDIRRFERLPYRARERSGGLTVVYSGSLQLDRCEGLIDLDKAVELLPQELGRVRILVFTSHVSPVAAERLAASPRIELRPALADEDVPAVLKEADVVFLPESFNQKWRQYIRYSISSKAHLYMMSGRPAIVYGPPGIGVVEYARGDQWAEVVDERNPARLAGALASLLTKESQVTALVARAREVALRNHDAERVREQFLHLLAGCASGKGSGSRPCAILPQSAA